MNSHIFDHSFDGFERRIHCPNQKAQDPNQFDVTLRKPIAGIVGNLDGTKYADFGRFLCRYPQPN